MSRLSESKWGASRHDKAALMAQPGQRAAGNGELQAICSRTSVYQRSSVSYAQRASDACIAAAFTCVPSPHHHDFHTLAAAGKASSAKLVAVTTSQLPASQSPDRTAAHQHTPAAEQTPCALLESPSHVHALFQSEAARSCLCAPRARAVQDRLSI